MKTDVWGIKEVADITLSVRESRMGVSLKATSCFIIDSSILFK